MPIARYGVFKGRPIARILGAGQNPHYQIHVVDSTTDERIAVNVKSKKEPSELLYAIDEDLQHYLDHSEQMPSALGCEVLLDAQGGVLRAAGVLAQTFPGGDTEVLDQVRASIRDGALADLLRQPREGDALIKFRR